MIASVTDFFSCSLFFAFASTGLIVCGLLGRIILLIFQFLGRLVIALRNLFIVCKEDALSCDLNLVRVLILGILGELLRVFSAFICRNLLLQNITLRSFDIDNRAVFVAFFAFFRCGSLGSINTLTFILTD